MQKKKKEKVKIKAFTKLQRIKENEVDMCLVFFFHRITTSCPLEENREIIFKLLWFILW